MKKVLVIDDDPAFNKMLSHFLERNNFQVVSAHSANTALLEIERESFDLVLTDFRLPGMDGLELIKTIKSRKPELPVILITNYADVRTAVNSIKFGAFEFVSKPLIPDEFLVIVNKALSKQSEVKIESTQEPKKSQPIKYIVGTTEEAKKLWEYVELVAPTRMSVLILGESGTGKEYVARALHEKSKRASQEFIALDCGVLSKELAGSELFGHVKGAFTGATIDKKGLFELANGGTLFLDEVGNLPIDVQIQLLRTIQEKVIRRIGSEKDIAVDVRLIAATNENIGSAISDGNFRNDLLHRLNEFELNVPALRTRVADLNKFISFFMDEASEELGKIVNNIEDSALEILKKYSWPGNLRELKNIIKRSVLLSQSNTITVDHLPKGLISQESGQSDSIMVDHSNESSSDYNFIEITDLKHIQEMNEKELITRVLKENKYNKSKTAKQLNIDRTTLYQKIKKFDIDA
ncbi:sigma-54-dependent transcriptional regulator [Fulvivirgaceae bacterium LMO-SS25]